MGRIAIIFGITMSTARQQRKVCSIRLVLLLAVSLAGCGIYIPQVAWAGTTERVVSDPQTGLAISGFDPVAYFTDAAAKFGRPTVEYQLDGVIWRFRNDGNKAAFVERPDIYMPRFGGYDPVAVARGKAVAGHPLYWLIKGERLYLFYDAKDRAEFDSESERILLEAERRWPEVEHDLTP